MGLTFTVYKYLLEKMCQVQIFPLIDESRLVDMSSCMAGLSN